MSDLQLDNTLPWGKYKGQKLADIFKKDAAYLCWLRKKRKDDSGDVGLFGREIHLLLDAAIDSDKALRSQGYTSWGTKLAVEHEQQLEREKERQAEAVASAAVYDDAWGAF